MIIISMNATDDNGFDDDIYTDDSSNDITNSNSENKEERKQKERENKRNIRQELIINNLKNALEKTLIIADKIIIISADIKSHIESTAAEAEREAFPPKPKIRDKKINKDINNSPEFDKFLQFIESHYQDTHPEFIDNSIRHSNEKHINTNISNMIKRLAKDILEYNKFQDVDINKLTDEEIEIFSTPIAKIVIIEINLMFLFILRELCKYMPPQIINPMLDSLDNGQLFSFIVYGYYNLLDISNGNKEVNKKIVNHLKNIFDNNIPDEIKNTTGVYDYYYLIFRLIAFANYVMNTFSSDIQPLINKRNMTYTSESPISYQIIFENVDDKNDNITETSFSYPTKPRKEINGKKYKITKVITEKNPQVSYDIETILVQSNGELDITNLTKFFSNSSNACYDIIHELTVAGWSIVNKRKDYLSKSDYNYFIKTKYKIHYKGNGLYEIRMNPRVNFNIPRLFNPENARTNNMILDPVPSITSHVKKAM